MTTSKSKRIWIWLGIALGIIALGIGAFFIIKAITSDGRSFKEYNIEQTVDGITLKLNSVERLPMTSEECKKRVIHIGGDGEDYTCIIANITLTNTTDKKYKYVYRNFGYREPGNDKLRPYGITQISFEGIDITKDMSAGESHTQDVFYSIRKDIDLSTLQMVYRIKLDGAEISLPL